MKKGAIVIFWILMLAGCSKSGSNPGSTNTNPGGTNTVPAPTKATLTFPDQNGVCISGTIVSDSMSTITFTWNAGSNTESYDVYIKNLLTSVSTTQSASQTQLAITLQRNIPYSWYIISKSSKTTTTAQSDTWKFYNAGNGTVSYAPFPAEISLPSYGQIFSATTSTVNLAWTGSSVISGTIANYDIYFGTSKTPSVLKAAVVSSSLSNVPVTSKTTYYWKVITRDVSGNTSDSGLYEFSIN